MMLIKKTGKILFAAIIVLSLFISTSVMAFYSQAFTPDKEPFYVDYGSMEETLEAAYKVADQAVAEGTVLLKNKDGALPLASGNRISAFGLANTSESGYVEGFTAAGFDIVSSSYDGSNEISHNESILLKNHKDAAIVSIVCGSGSGEGKAAGLVKEEEDNLDGNGNAYEHEDGTAFTHESLATLDGKEYKHSLMLTEAQEELIAYVTENYDKVIVLIGGSNPMEAGILEANEDIDAILWTGVLSRGYQQVAEIISGKINPSGRTVSNWAWDFTSDPTWKNEGNNSVLETPDGHINSSGYGGNQSSAGEGAYAYKNVAYTRAFRYVPDSSAPTTYAIKEREEHARQQSQDYFYVNKYEEDLYFGYRYFETEAAEKKLEGDEDYNYDNEVVYPFGYGQSYTDFTWEVVGKDYDDWGKQQDAWTKDGKLTVDVKVTNTGDVAGKDVVEIYGHAPYYKGGIEKTEVHLVAFEKTALLNPGQSQTLRLTVNIQDLASFDYDDANGNNETTYELDKVAGTDTAGNALSDSTGKYELRLQKNSHDVVLTETLADLASDIILSKDDYSGNEVEALFSGDNMYNLLGYDPGANDGAGATQVEEGKMELLSRDNFDKSTIKFETEEQLVRSDEYFASFEAFAKTDSSKWEAWHDVLYGTTDETRPATEDESQFPWAIDPEEYADEIATWDQRDSTDDLAAMQASEDWLWFTDLWGVAKDDPKWTTLINQMTVEEMQVLVINAAHKTPAVESIGKPKTRYQDSAKVVDIELSNSFDWGGCPHYAATWNKDLMYQRGVVSGNIALWSDVDVGMNGWYAPAIDIIKSPFQGRSAEYMSEDGFLSGHMAGNVVEAMEDKGILCTIKHCALNESETARQSLVTYVTEQAARECYFKGFQIVLQEYDGKGIMTSYNNIGDLHSEANYMFLNKLIRQEWGFNAWATTDAVSGDTDFFTMDMALRSGLSCLLNREGTNTAYPANGDWVDGTGNNAGYLAVDGEANYTQWYWLRQAVHDLLYTEVNLSVTKNGVDLSDYAGRELKAATQGESYGVSVAFGATNDTPVSTGNQGGGPGGGRPRTAAAENATEDEPLPEIPEVSYSIVDGELPAGLTLSSSGTITGTPTVSGKYTFTVRCSSYEWIYEEATYTLNVGSAFFVEGDFTVGTAVTEAYIDSTIYDIFTDDTYTRDYSFEFTIDEGSSLPAGLSMDAEGNITGTPSLAGTFTLNGTLTKGGIIEQERGPGNLIITEQTESIDVIVVIEVAAGEDVEPQFRVNDDGMIQYSEDGGITWTDVIDKDEIKGETGATGPQGETGATGPAGPQGPAGESVNDDGGCGGNIAGTVAIVGGLLILSLAAFIAFRRKEK